MNVKQHLISRGLGVAIIAASMTLTNTAFATNSGIQGTAVISPSCGGVQEMCSPAAYEGVITIKSADDNSVVAIVYTDVDGNFSADLDPGTYLLQQGEDDGLLMSGPPWGFNQVLGQEATVVDNEFTQVELVFDLGIR